MLCYYDDPTYFSSAPSLVVLLLEVLVLSSSLGQRYICCSLQGAWVTSWDPNHCELAFVPLFEGALIRTMFLGLSYFWIWLSDSESVCCLDCLTNQAKLDWFNRKAQNGPELSDYLLHFKKGFVVGPKFSKRANQLASYSTIKSPKTLEAL